MAIRVKRLEYVGIVVDDLEEAAALVEGRLALDHGDAYAVINQSDALGTGHDAED